MPNTIKTISLTDDDKSYLNKLLTQSTLEIRVYQRARILLLKSEGASNKAIADKLDIGISVVKRCLNKFKENGVEASLRDNKGRGRKAEITDDDITWVISKACQKPKDYGYSAEFWYPMSFRKFINSIAETEGHPRMATVAETTLRKILSNARIKPFQVSYYCERRDPEFDAKMHDVLVIYKQIEMQFDKDGKLIPFEKDAVHTLSYDEKPGIQAIATTGISSTTRPTRRFIAAPRPGRFGRIPTARWISLWRASAPAEPSPAWGRGSRSEIPISASWRWSRRIPRCFPAARPVLIPCRESVPVSFPLF